jgi:N,N'-diacetyllegionaminate synthase
MGVLLVHTPDRDRLVTHRDGDAKVILFGKNLDQDVVVIAEIGVNHEGDVETASRLVRLAAEAGADAVKFQTYTPERYISAGDPERLARVRRFGLDADAHRRLAREAAALGTVFFSSAISEDVIPLLDELCPTIKIASGDIDFEPVIRAATCTGKPVILSTGTATLDEVDRAVGWVRDEIDDDDLRQRLVLLHCVSAYPTPIEQANLLSVPFLAERYGIHSGYSNHVIGRDAVLGAIALGADVIEVHFTDQKEGRTFRDHQLSFDADDLHQLCEIAPKMRRARGVRGVVRQPCETGSAAAMRKGVVAARAIPAGTVLRREDLMFARPATEIPAAEVSNLVGKTTSREFALGESLRRESLS